MVIYRRAARQPKEAHSRKVSGNKSAIRIGSEFQVCGRWHGAGAISNVIHNQRTIMADYYIAGLLHWWCYQSFAGIGRA